MQMIAEQSPNLNSRKRVALKAKLDPERSLWPSILRKLMNSKGTQNAIEA
jgi:hypothetical protein